MSDNVSKAKRAYLIEKMQGTKENPRLKDNRKKLLGIKTAARLAEILDVTPSTMSKLEKCVNQISASQYLALCAILEKRKHELLIDIKNNVNKKIAIEKLVDMSTFYDVKFVLTIVNSINASEGDILTNIDYEKISISEENIIELQKMTCLDNWLSSFDYRENISLKEEKSIFKNNKIIILLTGNDDDIGNITDMMTKYMNIKGKKENNIYFDSHMLIHVLNEIKNEIKDNNIIGEKIDFVIKFSILKKEGIIKLNKFREDLPIMPEDLDDTSKKIVFVTCDKNKANEAKKIMYHQIATLERKEGLLPRIIVKLLENIDFIRVENGDLKRWDFDEVCSESLERLNRLIETSIDSVTDFKSKENFEQKSIEVKKRIDEINDEIDEELFEHMSTYKNAYIEQYMNYYKWIQQATNEELNKEIDNLLEEITSYLTSK